jgi:hypothetical protein
LLSIPSKDHAFAGSANFPHLMPAGSYDRGYADWIVKTVPYVSAAMRLTIATDGGDETTDDSARDRHTDGAV